MQRAVAAALIRKGRSIIHNAGYSSDDRAALSMATDLGASVVRANNNLILHSDGIKPRTHTIHAVESGLSSRLFACLAALGQHTVVITGEGSLLKRPFHFFDEIFPLLGVYCKTNNGCLPMEIRGPMKPENIKVDGSISSQYLTGLIMAFSVSDAEDVMIEVKDLKSKPYIDLTLDLLNQFKLRVPLNYNYESFYFGKTKHEEGDVEYTVEGDWSSAAFLLVAGALSGELVVKGLDVFSMQADRAILQPLMQTGAGLSIEMDQITVRRGNLQAFHFNATDCPDLFPPLAALAACCQGTSVIEGVHRLTFKESDRARVLQSEVGKLGIEIIVQDDMLVVKGGSTIHGGTVNSNGDHRIAMALSLLGLRAENEIVIEEAEVIDKSYPQFYADLEFLGASLSLMNNS